MKIIPRVTVQCVHVTLMNVLNRSSSSALDLQYDDTMETRCSERGLHTLADAELLKHFESTTLTTGENTE